MTTAMRTQVTLLSTIILLGAFASSSAQTTSWPFPDSVNFSFTIYGSLITHQHYGHPMPGYPLDTTFISGNVLDEPDGYAPISLIFYGIDSGVIDHNHLQFSRDGGSSFSGNHNISISITIDTINHIIDTFDFAETMNIEEGTYLNETASLELRNILYNKDSLFFGDNNMALHFDGASYFTSEYLSADHIAGSNTSGPGDVDSITIFGHTLYRNPPSSVNLLTPPLTTLNIIPSMANEYIRFQLPSDDGSLVICNILGQQLYLKSVSTSQDGTTSSTDTRSWPNGTYMVSFTSKQGSMTSKFVVLH